VPFDTVVVLVVEDSETGLVVELLQALDSYTNIILSLDGTLFLSFEVVRLGDTVLSSVAPESVGIRFVRGRDPGVAGSSPEPTVHIDRLKVGSVAAFVLEVAFSSTSPHARDIILSHDLLEHLELAGSVEGDEVHAPVPAEVPSVEPVPVLKLVPGLSPGEEVVMISDLHVGFSFHTFV